MNTIICFRQGGNNLRLGNTLVWVEQAIDWCKKHDFIFWLPNADDILGELCDDSSDVFSVPVDWEKSIFYQSERFKAFLGRMVNTLNEVKHKGSVSDFVFTCSIIPEIIAYVDPHGNTDWSDVPTDLISFLGKYRLVIVNDPYPFIFSKNDSTVDSYLKPSEKSIHFIRKILVGKAKNIGIHIRQGDYKNWLGGRYYKNSEFYNDLINLIANRFDKTDVNIFITHNGEFELSQSNKQILPDNQLLYSDIEVSDAIRDFLVLSACNVVIGPRSTFSQQALKWGQRNDYCCGKWLPIESSSRIEDIVEQINFELESSDIIK